MRVPTKAGNHQTAEADDRAIADACLPFIGEYGLSTIALMNALDRKYSSSEIYRALANDGRVFGKIADGDAVTLFRRRAP